ncbi:MAG: cupin domain-containing protein [Acidobacteria bacterium]|nr:cupin domain-containing protein [Acidobacteriota bacterium]
MNKSASGMVRKMADAPRQIVGAGTATEMQVLLGPEDGTPHFAMRRFIMGEGGGMPRHTNTVEHEQFVLRGRARVTIEDRTFQVEAGTVLYIPAGARHDYQVLEAPFEFLCLVPNKVDRVEICGDEDAG